MENNSTISCAGTFPTGIISTIKQLVSTHHNTLLHTQGTPEGVENNGTISRVGTFPIGIDPERFTLALETDEVQSHVAKLLNRYAGRKVCGKESCSTYM